jgi:hypothetical protein
MGERRAGPWEPLLPSRRRRVTLDSAGTNPSSQSTQTDTHRRQPRRQTSLDSTTTPPPVPTSRTNLPSAPGRTCRPWWPLQPRPSHPVQIRGQRAASRSAGEEARATAGAHGQSGQPPPPWAHTCSTGKEAPFRRDLPGRRSHEHLLTAASTCDRPPLAQLAGHRHARPRRPSPICTAAKGGRRPAPVLLAPGSGRPAAAGTARALPGGARRRRPGVGRGGGGGG